MRCDRCGEIIGTYEPAWLVLPDGTAVRGSPLTLRERCAGDQARVLHETCYRELVAASFAA